LPDQAVTTPAPPGAVARVLAVSEEGERLLALLFPQLPGLRIAWGWRRLTVTPESYGHQTTVLLERLR
jgi:hypothetical protein